MDNLFMWHPVKYWMDLEKKVIKEWLDRILVENHKFWDRIIKPETDMEILERAYKAGIPKVYRDEILAFSKS